MRVEKGVAGDVKGHVLLQEDKRERWTLLDIRREGVWCAPGRRARAMDAV